jgi:predicted small lipoprotein YifL
MIQRSSVVAPLALLATLAGCELLVGCGLKGPLYVPEDKPPQEVSAQPGTTDDTKKPRSTNGGASSDGSPPAVPTDTTGAPPSSTPLPNGN